MTSISERLGNWLPALIALALPITFIPRLIDAFILPRASIVIAGACIGGGLALLIPGRPGLGRLRWPLIAGAAAALLAFAFSVSYPLSLVGSYTRYESLPIRLSYLALLAVPVWLIRTDRARTAVFVAFVFGVSVSSLEAAVQWWQQVPFRPDGNLGNANLLGALVGMALPLTVARILRFDRLTPAWLLAAVAMLAGLVASTSRGGALAALAGCLALAAFALRGRAAAAVAAVSAAVIVGALLLILLSPLRNLNGDPGPTRTHLYPDAVQLVLARPITGWGEDVTGLVIGRFLTGDWSPGVTFDRAHAGALDLAATQGLIGLGALGWVILVLAVGLWRARLEPTVQGGSPSRGINTTGAIGAACFAYLVWVSFNFDWAPATGAFWLLAGTGWSAVRAQTASPADETAAPPPAGAPLRRVMRVAGAVGLVAIAAGLAAMPILADAWYAQGRADLAVRVDPLQAQYHRALGETLIARGSAAGGLAELRLAARLGASDPGLYVELGDQELAGGDIAQARTDYRMALTIDPYWAPAKQRLAAHGGLGGT